MCIRDRFEAGHYIFIRIGSECYAGHFQAYASGQGLQQRVQPDRWGVYIGRGTSEDTMQTVKELQASELVDKIYLLGSDVYKRQE